MHYADSFDKAALVTGRRTYVARPSAEEAGVAGFFELLWRSVRMAGTPGYVAWCLLVVAILVARLTPKKDVALGLIAIAWYLALNSVAVGYIEAFNVIDGPPCVSDFLGDILSALSSLVPTFLLTLPAIWSALDGKGMPGVRGMKLLLLSVLVGLLDILLLAWAISSLSTL